MIYRLKKDNADLYRELLVHAEDASKPSEALAYLNSCYVIGRLNVSAYQSAKVNASAKVGVTDVFDGSAAYRFSSTADNKKEYKNAISRCKFSKLYLKPIKSTPAGPSKLHSLQMSTTGIPKPYLLEMNYELMAEE